jgi:hypothetical protein
MLQAGCYIVLRSERVAEAVSRMVRRDRVRENGSG